MCTAVVRITPGAAWPVLLAFVRDELRSRSVDPAGAWWPEQPSVIGGRDQTHGGTWLALDTESANPRVACVLNRLDAVATPPAPEQRISRGTLPLELLQHGDLQRIGRDLANYDPFTALLVTRNDARSWAWDGQQLTHLDLQPGVHMVTSHGVDRTDVSTRQATWLPRFTAVDAPDPDTAWAVWGDLLDGANAQVDDEESIVVAGVSQYPGFGTVGGTLVGIGANGDTRMRTNASYHVDRGSWVDVSTSPS